MVPPNNVTEANIGGRLVPKTSLATSSAIDSLMDAFNTILSAGGVVSGIVTNQTNFPQGGVKNSVNPAFRNSVIDVVIGL